MSDNNVLDTRPEQCFGWQGSTIVIAWLKCHIGGCTIRDLFSILHREWPSVSMGLQGGMPSFCDDFTVLDENTTDQIGVTRPRPRSATSRALHECLVFQSCGVLIDCERYRVDESVVHPWIHGNRAKSANHGQGAFYHKSQVDFCGKVYIKKRRLSGFEVVEHDRTDGHGAELSIRFEQIEARGRNNSSLPLAAMVRTRGPVVFDGTNIPLYRFHSFKRLLHNPWNQVTIRTLHDILVDGVDRSCGAWRLEGVAAPTLDGYPSPPSNAWDGDAKHDGRTVRWVFLESDAGITSAISRAKLRRAKWIKGPKKYTYLGVTTIPFWPRRKVEMALDDGDQHSRFNHDDGNNRETFGGGYRVVPNMYPTRKDGSIVLAYRLSRLQMLSLMGPVKKGKHVGKWGIEQIDVNRVTLRPVDKDGNPSDVPVGHPTFIQADGEPLLQLPATLEWHQDQIISEAQRTSLGLRN